ncbi:hypothetical protein [Cryptosporangium sp. NPDC048952]|uniref:hypothetical protein n=1 Tax=Cryptosporangium sp. NPDC048952 TaxID=3363961 RepID=UPI00371925E1
MPVLALPVDAGPGLLFETARLDRSGRLFACGLLRALRWPPGHQVEIDAIEGALVIGSAPGGRHTVGDRGDLALPAALRRLCGIVPGPPILLVASVPEDRLVAHRASTVVRLLGELHALLVDGADDVG